MRKDGIIQEVSIQPFNSVPQMVISIGTGDNITLQRIPLDTEIEYLDKESKAWIPAIVISVNTVRVDDTTVELDINTEIRLKEEPSTVGQLILDNKYANIEYGAEDLQTLLRFMYMSGVVKDMLFGEIIASGGMQVTIQSTMAIIDGCAVFFKIPQQVVLNNGYSTVRKDLIVLRKVQNESTGYIAVKEGIPTTNPQVPTLTEIENGIYEIPIAEVTVQPKVTSISGSDIKDVRRIIPTLSTLQDMAVPPFYLQFTDERGVFNNDLEPTNYYFNKYSMKTVWKLLFANESVYFRTEGILSENGRNGGIQGDAIRSIHGAINNAVATTHSGFTGSFRQIDRGLLHYANGQYTLDYVHLELNSNLQGLPSASENRVRNRLMRIYQRIS